jgi:small GTP-binding protein
MDPITYKIITLGSYSVGKTCLLMRATQQDSDIPETYKCTIGVDFRIKFHSLNSILYKFAIWDTAGQERFQHINRLYYKGSHAVLLVYDVGNRESFEKVENYYYDFKHHCDDSPVFLIIANKIDRSVKKVTNDEGKRLADKLGVAFLEVSAFTGEGVEKIFDLVLKDLENCKVFKRDIESFLVKEPKVKNRPVSKCC